MNKDIWRKYRVGLTSIALGAALLSGCRTRPIETSSNSRISSSSSEAGNKLGTPVQRRTFESDSSIQEDPTTVENNSQPSNTEANQAESPGKYRPINEDHSSTPTTVLEVRPTVVTLKDTTCSELYTLATLEENGCDPSLIATAQADTHAEETRVAEHLNNQP